MTTNNDQQSPQVRFGGNAQNYVSSVVHGGGYSLDRLIELVEPTAGKRALDLATGGGHVALAMAQHGADVVASDLTMKMLQASRTNHQQKGLDMLYCCNDAQNVPFIDSSFDIVTTRLAPHHFPDVPRYVQECTRVLKSGGVYGLVDHAGAPDVEVGKYVNAYEKLRDPSHRYELSQLEWEDLFRDNGLRVINSELHRERLNFNWWNRMQNNDADTVMRLRVMLKQAPQAVAEWLEPETPDGAEWYFTRWMIIIVGVKA
ncbi:MAG: class I SAM-dependent methyltransferase [Anaerolineae bacterium]